MNYPKDVKSNLIYLKNRLHGRRADPICTFQCKKDITVDDVQFIKGNHYNVYEYDETNVVMVGDNDDEYVFLKRWLMEWISEESDM